MDRASRWGRILQINLKENDSLEYQKVDQNFQKGSHGRA